MGGDEAIDRETYLQKRVDKQLEYYEGEANKAKRTYYSMQTAVIILGLIIPVAVNIPTKWGT